MLALGLGLSASVAWGGSDLVAGLAGRRLPLLTVLIGAQASGLALLIALLLVVGGRGPSAHAGLLAAGAGLAELAGYAALYKSLALGPMSVVAPISSIAAIVPVSVAVAGGQPIAAAAAVGIGLALIGAAAACAERSNGERSGGPIVRGAVLAAVAALCFGAFFVAIDAATKQSSPTWAVVIDRLASVTALAVIAALTRPGLSIAGADLRAVSAVGVLDGAANAMFAFALMHGLSSTVSVAGSLAPVTTVILAALLLKERLALLQTVGLMTVLAGVALFSGPV